MSEEPVRGPTGGRIGRLAPGVAESASPPGRFTAGRRRQLVNNLDCGGRVGHNYKLGDAIAPAHRIGRRPEVDQSDNQLAAIPAVDEARRVDHRHAVVHSQSGAGQDESGPTGGNSNGQPRRYRNALPRREFDVGGRAQIEAGVAGTSMGWKGHVRVKPAQREGDRRPDRIGGSDGAHNTAL